MKTKQIGLLFIIIAFAFSVSPVTAKDQGNIKQIPPTGKDAKEIVAEDMPMGQDAGNERPSLLPEDAILDGETDLFGLKGGYLHPFLSLQGEWTDNLYNVDDGKTTNFLTTISPGLWFALPRKRQIPLQLALNNTSAGGLQTQLKDYEGTDRYQAYIGGGLDIKYYSEDSELNDTDVLLEGLFRYNMKSGLSLQVVDRYTQTQDIFEVGTLAKGSVGRYDSNILMGTIDWVFTEKTRAKLEVSNFWLDYEEDIDNFQNRKDNAFDLYGYYIYSEKTSFFLEYKFVDVSYDEATANDNSQNYVYGGITWYTTEKLALMAKAGLQKKSFANSGVGLAERTDTDGFVLDIQAKYQFTEKTDITLGVYRNNQETDSTLASDQDVFGLLAEYKQDVTDKIRVKIDAGYEKSEYSQLIERDREDDQFYIRPSLHYLFKDWIKGEIAYEFETRDSTDNLFDYQTNTFIINLTVAL